MSAHPGYHGHLLDVDLSTGAIGRCEVPPELYRDFVGGRGLGVRLLWELLPGPGVDALGPDNPLLFLAGPFSGLPIPSASRTCVVTKSPITSPRASEHAHASTVSYSNIGGFFGPELRFAGYDGLLLRGSSPEPVVLVIDDDQAQLRPAGELWGLGTEATDHALVDQLGRRFRTAYIGPAGENLSLRATILHTAARAAGRGVGAVMGSKRVKAIAVHGSGQPTVADHAAFLKELERARRRYHRGLGRALTSIMRKGGTAGFIERNSKLGHEAVQNYREGTFAGTASFGARAAREEVWVRNSACFCCRLSCKKGGAVRSGDFAHVVHDGPEYETASMLGSNLMLDDIGGVLKAITLADDLGLDAISAGNVLGFLMEAHEKGDMSLQDLDGIDLRWGDARSVHAMLAKLASCEGVGELASQGVAALSAHLGEHTAPYAIHVKGLELAGHNIHDNPDMALTYATSNRGACHMAGHHKDAQDLTTAVDCLGICLFACSLGGMMPGLKPSDAAALLTSITGEEWSAERLLEVGDRTFTAERLFNAREGFTTADDALPERFYTEPLTVGKEKGAVLDREGFAARMADWYASRGIDPITGRPVSAKLESLGLEGLV